MKQPMRRSIAETRRATIDRIESVAAQGTWVMGRVLVEGIGESRIDVTFPVTFGERPLPILGGGEVLAGDSAKPTRFPTANVMVDQWDTDGTYYRGATLAITTTGRSDQKMYVTFAFIGSALTNTATN